MGHARQTGRLWQTAGHFVHAGSFLILLGTGVLLFAPALRSHFIGGYSLHLRLVHCWMGGVFAVGTLPFVAAILPASRRAARADGGTREPSRIWRNAHLLFTVGSAAAFTATGLVLWQQDRFGLVVADSSVSIHRWLTYLAAAVLGVHLSVAVFAPALRAARARCYRGGADREPPPRAVQGAASCG